MHPIEGGHHQLTQVPDLNKNSSTRELAPSAAALLAWHDALHADPHPQATLSENGPGAGRSGASPDHPPARMRRPHTGTHAGVRAARPGRGAPLPGTVHAAGLSPLNLTTACRLLAHHARE